MWYSRYIRYMFRTKAAMESWVAPCLGHIRVLHIRLLIKFWSLHVKKLFTVAKFSWHSVICVPHWSHDPQFKKASGC